jgi:hypothetical protein
MTLVDVALGVIFVFCCKNHYPEDQRTGPASLSLSYFKTIKSGKEDALRQEQVLFSYK